MPQPYTSVKDVFCIRYKRIADGYLRVTLAGHSFQIPKIQPGEDVDLHLIAHEAKNQVEIRFWAVGKLVHMAHLPLMALDKAVYF